MTAQDAARVQAEQTPDETIGRRLAAAAAMLPGWTCAPTEYPGAAEPERIRRDTWTFTNGPLEFHASRGGYGRYGQLSITDRYPRPGGVSGNIHLAESKTPAAIARDLAGRYLPGLVAAAAEHYAAEAARTRRRAGREAMADSFIQAAAAEGVEVKPSPHHAQQEGYQIELYNVYAGEGHDKISFTIFARDDDASIKADRLPPDLAAQIVQLIAARLAPCQAEAAKAREAAGR